MRTEINYERSFDAAPDRVFAAFVNTLAHHGQIHSIEGYGTVVTFTPVRSSASCAPQLTAQVQPWHGGSLVQVTGAMDRVTGPQDEDEVFMRVMTLLGLVSGQLELARPSAPTSRTAGGSGPAQRSRERGERTSGLLA